MLSSIGVQASAAESDSGWVELLDVTSLNDDGSNKWTIKGTSGTMVIPLPVSMRLRKIDMLVVHNSSDKPTSAYSKIGSYSSKLTIESVSTALSRVYGYVQTDFYSELKIAFTKSTTTSAYYEILSCKVSELHAQDFAADCYVALDTTTYQPNTEIKLAADSFDTTNSSLHLWVFDWTKYDYLSISVNARDAIPLSFSAYLGYMPIDIEVSAFSDTTSGSWEFDRYYSDGTNNFSYTTYSDNTMGTRWVTVYIPLINLDRTISEPLRLSSSFLVGPNHDAYVNYVSVTGGLFVPDRSAVAWWNQYKEFSEQQSESWWDRFTDHSDQQSESWWDRFTDHSDQQSEYWWDRFTDHSKDQSDSWWDRWTDQANERTESWWDRFTEYMDDLFAGSADQSNAAIESAQQQSQDLINDRLGAVSQAGDVMDSLVSVFDDASTVKKTIEFPALAMTFGDASFVFGGWNVKVIPDGFEPIIETLKLIIDIVATLAFLQAMRSRFERLLAGGNA